MKRTIQAIITKEFTVEADYVPGANQSIHSVSEEEIKRWSEEIVINGQLPDGFGVDFEVVDVEFSEEERKAIESRCIESHKARSKFENELSRRLREEYRINDPLMVWSVYKNYENYEFPSLEDLDDIVVEHESPILVADVFCNNQKEWIKLEVGLPANPTKLDVFAEICHIAKVYDPFDHRFVERIQGNADTGRIVYITGS